MHESFLTSETLVFEVFVCIQAAVALKWDDVKDKGPDKHRLLQ